MSEYDVPSYNKEEEEEQKLTDKVYDWFESLSEQEQFDIMYDHFPDEITVETDVDKFFGDMVWENQLDVYLTENHLTEEELLAQKDWYDPDIELEERKLEEEMDYEWIS